MSIAATVQEMAGATAAAISSSTAARRARDRPSPSSNHLTNVGALAPGCEGPGAGVFIDTHEGVAADAYSIINAVFWGNAPGHDVVTACASGCGAIKVDVSYSMVQTKYEDGSIAVRFGEGLVEPADPLFVAPEQGDFRLQPGSPAIGKGSPSGDLGAYGYSASP